MALDPLRRGLVRQREPDRTPELLLRCVWVVRAENPGVRLDDLGKCPERSLFAVRQRAASPPADGRACGVERRRELGDQAALADAWNADDVDEMRGAVERASEQVELLAPAHERDGGPQHVAEAGTGADGLPHAQRRRLPLRLHGIRWAV